MRIRYILVVVALVILVSVWTAYAGDPDSSSDPGSTYWYTLEDIYNRLDAGTAGTQSTFTEPSSGPGTGTGHTLNEVMSKAPVADDTNGAVLAEVLTGKTYWSLRTDGTWGPQTGTMPNRGAVTIVPTTTNQTIAMGYHNGSGYVQGDADLAAGNIRSGVAIFGLSGNPNVVNTSSGDAVAADIVSSKKAWVDGSEVTGSMADNGAVTIVPTTTNQTIAMGYHNGSGYVQGDADLAAGNIRSGVAIFGVSGNPNVVNTSSGDAAAGDILSGKMAWVDGTEVTGNIATQTLSDSSTTVAAGYYAATTLDAVDGDLVAEGIVSDVVIFGVTGTYPYAPVPQTGQTISDSEATGDDGYWERGVSWPIPRFITSITGIVTDTLTGLIWLEDASCSALAGTDGDGKGDWATALSAANALANGTCGLSDGSQAGDWRLPNVRELFSLIDFSLGGPALPSGHPFTGVQWDAGQATYYWSSTTIWGTGGALAWLVELTVGYSHYDTIDIPNKGSAYYVWPIRDGRWW